MCKVLIIPYVRRAGTETEKNLRTLISWRTGAPPRRRRRCISPSAWPIGRYGGGCRSNRSVHFSLGAHRGPPVAVPPSSTIARRRRHGNIRPRDVKDNRRRESPSSHSISFSPNHCLSVPHNRSLSTPTPLPLQIFFFRKRARARVCVSARAACESSWVVTTCASVQYYCVACVCSVTVAVAARNQITWREIYRFDTDNYYYY